MPIFVRLHKLTAKGASDIGNFKKNLLEIRELQEKMGVRLIASYACLGEYDFVSIIEAPDDETAFRVSAAIGGKGNIATITMRAIPTDEFAELTTKL
jgi:uncharacterized protein with GYD domain